MATSRHTITTDEFIKANNGGLVDEAGCIIQILSGKLLIGVTDKDTNPPAGKDCYQLNTTFSYTGSDDVYLKAMSHDAIIIIDGV